MAVIKIKWTVEELANVLTQFDTQKVYRSTTGPTGTFTEITGLGTRVDLVVGQAAYEYDDTAGDPTYWYAVRYFHSVTSLESELSDPIQGSGGGNYVTVGDVRAQGFTESEYPDEAVADMIEAAESFVEQTTGRWFYPRNLTIRLDGTGSPILPVPVPVIQVDEIKLLSTTDPAIAVATYDDLDVSTVRIFNRHLTQGLRDPDDRDAPSLQYPPAWRTVWPKGVQNVQLSGWFGYTVLGATDTPGETSEGSQVPLSMGRCPPLIRQCALRVVARWLPQLSDVDEADDATRRWQIEKIKTRDQEIEYSDRMIIVGAITGDPEIDRVLSSFIRPAVIDFV